LVIILNKVNLLIHQVFWRY